MHISTLLRGGYIRLCFHWSKHNVTQLCRTMTKQGHFSILESPHEFQLFTSATTPSTVMDSHAWIVQSSISESCLFSCLSQLPGQTSQMWWKPIRMCLVRLFESPLSLCPVTAWPQVSSCSLLNNNSIFFPAGRQRVSGSWVTNKRIDSIFAT
jgi:hypothetical protein